MSKMLVIDTETGGLDPTRHSILSVGLVVWHDGAVEVAEEIHIAEPEMVVEPEAMEINEIDTRWLARNGLPPARAVGRIEQVITTSFPIERDPKVPVAGHNVHFDVAFIRRLYSLAGLIQGPRFAHRLLDTASVLKFLALAGLITESATSSTHAFKHFAIEFAPGERHSALADALATAELLTRTLELVRNHQ
jgi:DNA polymerase-3 subunit epsilon